MNLSAYLSSPGSVNRLAKDVVVHPVLVSQWKTGRRRVPAEHCPAIERATNGAVRCEELRPDIDWGYLRATDCDLKVSPGDTPTEPRKVA